MSETRLPDVIRSAIAAPLQTLREAVLEAASVESYRAVGRRSNLSPRTLRLFATCATVAPHKRTIRRVRQWYAQQMAGAHDEAVAVVNSLLAPLPPCAHAEGAMAIARTVAGLCMQHGVEVPPWADALSASPAG